MAMVVISAVLVVGFDISIFRQLAQQYFFWVYVFAFGSSVFVVYFTLMDLIGSLGKQLLNIEVRNKDNTKLEFWSSFIGRWPPILAFGP